MMYRGIPALSVHSIKNKLDYCAEIYLGLWDKVEYDDDLIQEYSECTSERRHNKILAEAYRKNFLIVSVADAEVFHKRLTQMHKEYTIRQQNLKAIRLLARD